VAWILLGAGALVAHYFGVVGLIGATMMGALLLFYLIRQKRRRAAETERKIKAMLDIWRDL
jgi:uncharacterized membrane protein YkvI